MTFLVITTIILSLVVHELGHAIEMKKRGIEIEEMGIGIKIPWLALAFKSTYFDCPVYISPLLLGAYVKPTPAGKKTMEGLDYKDQAIIYGAGVWMNFSFTLFLLIISIFVKPLPMVGAIALSVCLVVILMKNFFCRYVILLIGIASLGLLAYIFVSAPIQETVGGPASVFRHASEAKTLAQGLVFSIFISLNLALINCLPFLPLDGGRILRALLLKWRLERTALAVSYIGVISMFAIVVVALINDIGSFVR